MRRVCHWSASSILVLGAAMMGDPLLARSVAAEQGAAAGATGSPPSIGTADTSHASGESPQPPQNGDTVQDIVVTAQKREQNLQDVPIAVTALTGATLQMSRFETVQDLNALAPGLTVRPTSGGAQIPNFTMRGIQGTVPPGADRGVALYIDGVYINSSVGAAFDLADVDRVEVLRGPQGTLFGRNAIGGAINVITRDPQGELHVRQELTYGNYDQFRSKTRIDTPTWGSFAASLTYLHNQRRGDIRNLGAGTVWDYGPATDGRYGQRKSARYLGDEDVNAVAAAVKFTPSTAFNLLYKFSWSENHYSDAEGIQNIVSDPATNPTGAAVAGIVAAQPNPALLSPVTRQRPDAINNAFSTPGTLRTQDHNLTARYELSSEVSLKNILAYRKVSLDSTHELDGLGGLFAPDTPVPFVLLGSNTYLRERQWSDEFQLNVNTKWFNLTAGYLYYNVDTTRGALPGAPNVVSFSAIPDYVIASAGSIPSRIQVISNAVYVQDEIHLTPRLDLVGGSRLTWDHKYGLDTTLTGVPPVYPEYRGTKPSFLAELNFRPADHILTYAKYSTAFISGGEIATYSFNPSTVRSEEIGIKADLLDRRLRANLAVYHARYGQLQFNTSGINFGIPASVVIINGGNARANGAEFELTAVPLRGLSLQGNLSYTDFKYTSVNSFVGTLGSFLPVMNPKWTSFVSAQYETGEVFDGGHLLLRADANYTSSQVMVINQPAPIVDATKVPSTWIVNGRLALTGLDVAGKKAEVALWARNLTNNRSIVGGSGFSFLTTALYQPARTFGLDVNFDF